MKTDRLVTTLALVASVMLFSGCGADDPLSSTGTQPPLVTNVSPAEGATLVATSATITMQFNMPMDPQSVMANFHFLGGDELHEWMESLTPHHGSGGGSNMDHMMEWMDDIDLPGQYHWNEARDFCEFVPDGGLMPDTEYMAFIGGGMKSHNGGLMGTHHLEYDGYMYHFHTGP